MNDYYLVKASLEDVAIMKEIYDWSKAFLKTLNIDQWQHGLPNVETISADIIKNEAYLVKCEDIAVGLTVISLEKDPAYDIINEGEWINKTEPYVAIHKIAIAKNWQNKGIASFILTQAEKMGKSNGFKSLRADTHRGNTVMQHTFKKNNFIYCGKVDIITKGETLRFAYEKLI